MRWRRDVVEEIGEDDADEPRDRKADEDSHVDAGEREHRHPHRAEDDRASEVRLLHQQEGDRRRSRAAEIG